MANQLRVCFYTPAGDLAASLWVGTDTPAAAPSKPLPDFGARVEGPVKPPVKAADAPAAVGTLTLLHDYPDFSPQVGWRVTGRGLDATITAVDGRTLTCRKAD